MEDSAENLPNGNKRTVHIVAFTIHNTISLSFVGTSPCPFSVDTAFGCRFRPDQLT